jgi:rsbT co-antagonist protein RsbR
MEDKADLSSFRLVIANPVMLAITGFDVGAEAGQLMTDIFPQALETGLAQLYADVTRGGVARDLGEITYGDDRVSSGPFLIRAHPLANEYLCMMVEDLAEHKRAEKALRQAVTQEETIRAQAAILDELSTPLIPVNDRTVIMPIIGAVDSGRAQKMTGALLMGIATTQARVAILDITGVPVVDTQVANAFIQAAQAVQLLGATVVLTGIRPEVAQTLVGMGVDLQGMITRSTLQSGIAYALENAR